MIKRILKAITDHADFVSDLMLHGHYKLIPIRIVCRDCKEQLSTKTITSHTCVTIHGER